MQSMQTMQTMQTMQSPENNNDNNNHSIRVLRFEFSNAIIDALKAFTEVHRYDDRKTYKEAWAAWMLMEDTATIFNADVKRLTDLGYKGDVADKLFKSGRYYFRGKANKADKADKADKSDYADRKKRSMEITRALIAEHAPEHTALYDKHKKKDDLADCFLQGVWWLSGNYVPRTPPSGL